MLRDTEELSSLTDFLGFSFSPEQNPFTGTQRVTMEIYTVRLNSLQEAIVRDSSEIDHLYFKRIEAFGTHPLCVACPTLRRRDVQALLVDMINRLDHIELRFLHHSVQASKLLDFFRLLLQEYHPLNYIRFQKKAAHRLKQGISTSPYTPKTVPSNLIEVPQMLESLPKSITRTILRVRDFKKPLEDLLNTIKYYADDKVQDPHVLSAAGGP